MTEAMDRQKLFEGVEAPGAALPFDLDALAAYLDGRLEGLAPPLTAAKFKGGQSNPTYLLTSAGGAYVLRRKPPGTLVRSAHAIDREFRFLEALAARGFPVARPYLYCADEAVIGTEFFICEYVEGRVFWDAAIPGVEPGDRTHIYDEMNRTLAGLHNLAPDQAGLGDLQRTGGYCARNLRRWSDNYGLSKMIDIPDMDWLIEALPKALPTAEQETVIHGDYGLYNIIVHPDRPSLRAVLDWEMATAGDPFVDLAHHLRAWWDIPDPEGGATSSLLGKDLGALGIPAMDAYIETYCARRGIGVPDMTYYLSYAQFRYAAMVQGVLKRAQQGTGSNRNVLHRQERVIEIARLARQTLEGGPCA